MALVDETSIDEAAFRMSEATAGDFFALLKPRVMSLVVFTAFVGMVAAPVAINPLLAVIAILSIAIGAGASGALNMWYDADIDAVMTRTAGRPVPSGRIRPGEALSFGLVLSVLSVMTLGVLVNWLAATLLAFTIFFYAVVYTMWLKRCQRRQHAQDLRLVVGGAQHDDRQPHLRTVLRDDVLHHHALLRRRTGRRVADDRPRAMRRADGAARLRGIGSAGQACYGQGGEKDDLRQGSRKPGCHDGSIANHGTLSRTKAK